MEKLNSLIDILNRIKYEHNLKIEIDCEELNFGNIDNYDKLIQIKYSLDNVLLALGDAEMLNIIKEFMDISDDDRILMEEDLMDLKYKCETLNLQLRFLTIKLKSNQEQISELESENIKLKTDLKMNKTYKRSPDSAEEKPNIISPSYIQSSFKFNLNSENAKKYRENTDEVIIPVKLKTLYDLVMQYSIKGNYAVAIPLCEHSLIDIDKTSGKHSNDYASMLHVLANVYRDIGDYQKSVCLMLEVLLIRENLQESSKTKVVKTLNCISVLYGLMHCWSEAATYCRRSIAIMRKIYLVDDVRIAKQLESMALIHKNDNQIKHAIECLEEALPIYNADRYLYQFDVARVQSQLASCYLSQYQFDISLNLYKEAITNCYQVHLTEIWGLDKPLWQIAEQQECELSSKLCEMRSNYVDIRLLDGLDESGLRDILGNMAFIYRQLNMNKAAKFLETWPDRNIPAPTVPNRISKSRSLIHLNEEINPSNAINGRSNLSSSRGSLSYLSPVVKGLKTNVGVERRRNLSKRSSVSLSRKSMDIDVTIFESWSTPFNIKRSD